MRESGLTPDWLEELKKRNGIVEVISEYIELSKKGNRHFGLCPFHNEKTPSFAVNEDDGFYHCFGCNVSGDVITFIKEIENISFIEAVQHLCDRSGVEMPEFKGGREGERQTKDDREILFDILKSAATHYHNNLISKPEAEEARAYLHSRGITKDIIVRYGLGYSVDYDRLPTYLKLKNYPERLLKLSGVLSGERMSDALAGRIIVPIINSLGKVVAFGGRVVGKPPEGIAKYKNSTNTPLFDKGRTLYNLNFLKTLKRTGGFSEVILVEGYMDVISLGKVGILNTAAGMGTAFTESQARELAKWTNNIVLCYDGDEAGRKAAERSIDILVNEGFNVKVIALPDEMDPDDAAKKLGKAGILKLLDEAPGHVEYRLGLIEKKFDLKSASERAQYLKEALTLLSKIKDISERDVYLPILSDKSGVTVAVLRKQLDKTAAEKPPARPIESAPAISGEITPASLFVLNSLLFSREYADISKVRREWFKSEDERAVFDFVLDAVSFGKRPQPGQIFDHLRDSAVAPKVIGFEPGLKGEAAEKYYIESLIWLANESIKAEIADASARFENADKEERPELLTKIAALQKKLTAQSLEKKY